MILIPLVPFVVFLCSKRDDRGSIDRLRVGGKRINLLSSKTGVMRSGYLHPEPKYGFVVCGEVEVWVLTNTGTEKKVHICTCHDFHQLILSMSTYPSAFYVHPFRFTKHGNPLKSILTHLIFCISWKIPFCLSGGINQVIHNAGTIIRTDAS
jgi:hypothetical protein